MHSEWRLVVTDGGKVIFDSPLPVGVSTIGRSSDNRFVLPPFNVSRCQAMLFVSPEGQLHVQDMGSRNGTLMEGRPIARVRLKPGDVFLVGPYRCEARAGEATAAANEQPTLNDRSVEPPADSPDAEPFLGNSPAAKQLLAQARRAAATNLTVLLAGESGSGKGMVAKLIHGWSARSRGPWVVVNCAAIPGELVESELFGHGKGAFTGAVADRMGKFRAAQGGTLFLDEIGDLALPAQAKILRAIEEREIEPVGAPGPVAVDVRVLAATHQDLDRAVSEGRFRLDLFHRISTLTLRVPPLRTRKDDLVVLANCILAELVEEIPWAHGTVFSSEAIDALIGHDWPGNVRELRNVVAQALLARGGETIRPEDFSFVRRDRTGEAPPLTATLEQAEVSHIRRLLEHHDWNLVRAARALAISRSTLRARMRQLGLSRTTTSGDS